MSYHKNHEKDAQMFKIHFFQDERGKSPVEDYIRELSARKDKDSRIKLNKIHDYIKVLSGYGTNAGEPYMKHLEGEIWELRPISDRLLFFELHDGSFVLLHHFVKKTQKTPKREIEQAKRSMRLYIERNQKS